MSQLKRKITNEMIEHTNEGVCTHAIHFVETVALCMSLPNNGPIIVAHKKGKSRMHIDPADEDFNLSLVPPSHPLLNASVMKHEGEQYLTLLMTKLSRNDLYVKTIDCCYSFIKKVNTNL